MIDNETPEHDQDIILNILLSLKDNELINDPKHMRQAVMALLEKAAHISKCSYLFSCAASEILTKFFDEDGNYNR